MIKHEQTRRRPVLVTLASAAVILATGAASLGGAGCSNADDGSVRARLGVVNRSQSALSAVTPTGLKGTYGAGCSGRSSEGTDTWTLSMSGGPADDELSVRKNDADCVLTITAITADDAEFAPSAGIVLDQANEYSAVRSFKDVAEDPIDFYGNAKIDDLDFSNDFTITLQISDDPSSADAGSKSASYATQSGSVSASGLAASNYGVSFAAFSVEKDVENKVYGVSGYAKLTASTVTGEHYQVVSGAYDGNASLDAIEAAFTTPAPLSELTDLEIPAARFLPSNGSVDLDDAPKRTIIIRRTDPETGVKAYQMLLVTFTP